MHKSCVKREFNVKRPRWLVLNAPIFYEVIENISRHPLDILRLICKNIVQRKSGLVAHSNPNNQPLSLELKTAHCFHALERSAAYCNVYISPSLEVWSLYTN